MSTTFTNTGNFTGNLTGTDTGSWADSTHSVIWMSRSGKSPAMPNTNQPHAAQYASLTVAALLTIAAASNLIDVYGSALSWTSAAIPATIIGSLVALAGLVPALRLWWQMLFMACAQLVVGPVIFLNGTTIAHVIPTLRTLTQGWMRMLGSFKYLLAIDPPTGTGDGSLLAVWTICLWAALLAGNLSVLLQALTGIDEHGRAHAARLRHELLCVPARLVRHGRRLTLRLPPGDHLLPIVLTRIRQLGIAA